MYGGSHNLFVEEFSRIGTLVTFLCTNDDVDMVVAALTPKTCLVWLEVCSNPLMRLTDIKATADAVHKYNKDIIFAVDNTFLSPYIVVSSLH
jgi:cystathionine beta-lyase/cystathionine gamma-synthase